MIIIIISHIINVVIAGSMSLLLLTNARSMTAVYGVATPARSILASMYLAIALTSLVALIFPAYSLTIATVLFPLQIFYKLSTVFTVGKITHPVVLSNILISMVHVLSLIIIFDLL